MGLSLTSNNRIFFVSCFDIREVPESPGKWNWHRLIFLPFIFTYFQTKCEYFGQGFPMWLIVIEIWNPLEKSIKAIMCMPVKTLENTIVLYVAKKVSMTKLLTHTVAHSTKPSFMPKTNNQPPKKFLSLALSWAKVSF